MWIKINELTLELEDKIADEPLAAGDDTIGWYLDTVLDDIAMNGNAVTSGPGKTDELGVVRLTTAHEVELVLDTLSKLLIK